MAAPNIANASPTITGKSKGQALTTSVADLLENTASSGKVFKVNLLAVANIDGTNNADATLNFYDASTTTSYKIANTIIVPADSTLMVVERGSSLYLEEGDKLTGLASANGDLEVVISYEEIS